MYGLALFPPLTCVSALMVLFRVSSPHTSKERFFSSQSLDIISNVHGIEKPVRSNLLDVQLELSRSL